MDTNTPPAADAANSAPKNDAAPAQGSTSSSAAKPNLLAILAYIGPLVLVPFFVAKEDPFVKFHIKQGLVLLVIEAAVWVLGMFWWMMWPLYSLINLVTFILSIVGIIHVVKGDQKQLPIIGKFGDQFKI